MTTAPITRVPLQPGAWIRDFAWVGGVTGLGAPLGVFAILGNLNGETLAYLLLAGAAGAVSGASLGLLSCWLMAGRMRRWRRLWLCPLGLMLGPVWGVAAALATRFSSWGEATLNLSMIFAGIAGALQLGWCWPAYCVRRVNQRSSGQ